MADAKIRVIGKDQASGVMKKVKGSLGGLNAATIGLTLSLGSLVFATKKVIEAANQQELAETKLATALKAAGDFTDENFKRLTSLASALQKVTRFGDEATIAATAQLKAYSGLSIEMLEKLIPAAQDFAAAQGIDLKTAFELVGKSIGSTTNALVRYGIQIDTSGSKADKAQKIIEEMNKKFGGSAQAEAETFTGIIDQLGNSFGDLTETIGFFITKNETSRGILNTVKEAIDGIISAINRQIDDQEKLAALNEKLIRQQARLKREEEATGLTAVLFGDRRIKQASDRVKATQAEILTLKAQIKAESERDEASTKAAKVKTGEITKAEEKAAAKRIQTLAKTQDLMFEMETIGLEKYIEILNLRVEVFKGTEEERVLFALETEQRITELRQNAANEQMLITQELGRAVQGVFSAIENSIVGAIMRATDTTKSGLEKWKLFFQDMGRAVLAILARLIARLIIFRALTAALGPGGTIFGLGAKALTGFQTPEGVTRRVPGPSTQAVPVIAHGGETIGRQGGQPITINFNGIVTDPDATGEVVFDTLNQYMQRNGAVFA